MNESNIHVSSNLFFETVLISELGTCEKQEDSATIHLKEDCLLAAVCDGMGGLGNGEHASKAVVDYLNKTYEKSTEVFNKPQQFLSELIEPADELVYGLKDNNQNRLKTGTTIASVLITGNKLYWLSVGDSRIYIARNDEMQRITEDHNYYKSLCVLLEEKKITKELYDKEIKRGGALTSYIGIGGVSEFCMNRNSLMLQKDDLILITTDGLYRLLPLILLKRIVIEGVKKHGLQETAKMLYEKAADMVNGYQDNTTFVLIHVLK